MCEQMSQAESVSTVLGVLSCLYDNRDDDAALLLNLYGQDCRARGAQDACMLASMFSASMNVSMALLGEHGKERVDHMTMWWAEQCRN